MQYNQKFTNDLKAWLDTAPANRDLNKGAMMLLQLTGNRILYNQMCANLPAFAGYLAMHLQRYYNFRIKAVTHQQVQLMSEQVQHIEQAHFAYPKGADAAQSKEFRAGKRADHDNLPDNIKACYVENLSIVRRMREVHLQLRAMEARSGICPDSDRYPYLKELVELDERLHANWAKYDDYDIQAAAIVHKDDARQASLKALRLINLNKSRYKKKPTPGLKTTIEGWLKQVNNPSQELLQELKALGIGK